MKRTALFVMLLSVLVLAGCGGGSGGSSTDCSTGETAAEAAFDDFGTLLDDADMAPCLALVQNTCNCPNGGTVTVDQANFTVTFTDCTTDSGQIYEGTMTLSQDLSSISANFPTFDGCTNVTATNVVIDGGCSGTISGTCGGQTITCTMSDSSGECVPDNCTC